MFARIVTGSIDPGRQNEAIRLWHDSVAPSVKQQEGFISARLLVQRTSGKILSMGLWKSEADVKRSVEWNQGQINKFAGLFTASPLVEQYEVAAEA